MSTNSDQYNKLKDRLRSFEESKTEEHKLEEDALMLMANYLTEIERFQKANNVSRRDLAKMIGTSPSYLTQVFRGDKPLNFITLAKIRKALDLAFVVKAYSKESFKNLNFLMAQDRFKKQQGPGFSPINYEYTGLTPVKKAS